MKLRIILLNIVFSLCYFSYSFADIVYMKDGNEYKGNLVKITVESVIFKIEESGKTETFNMANVMKIELTKKREGSDINNLKDLKDDLLLSLIKESPLPQDYPNANYVTLYEEVNIVINPNLSCTETKRVVCKVLNESGINIADNVIYYLADNESVEIDFAKTMDVDGNIFHISDNAIEDGSVYGAGFPEYDKLHKVKFSLPEVKVGTIIDFKLTKKRKKIDVFAPLLIEENFRGEEPLLKKVVSAVIPKNLNLNTELFRGDKILFSEKEDKDAKKFIWTIVDSPKINPEPDMPVFEDIAPRLVAGIQDTWGNIGQECYRSLKKKFIPGKELEKKVKELIKSQKTAEDKAKALYDYVAAEIKYVNVPSPNYSYEPNELNDIFKNKFGNGLDKTYLLYGMLKSAGLNPYFLWICPQSAGELSKKVPSMGQFSIPLVVLNSKGKFQYLNPSFDTVPFNNLMGVYQKVYGLLIKAESQVELIETPLYDENKEFISNKLDVNLLPNGEINVQKEINLSGDYEIQFRTFKDLTPEEQNQEMQKQVSSIYPNAQLINFKISNLKDINERIKINITYKIPDYALKAGEELLVFQLPEINYDASMVGKQKREFPLQWPSKMLEANEISINIPDGYKISYLPREYLFNDLSSVKYYAKLTSGNKKILFKDEYRRNTINLSVGQYTAFKKCIEAKAAFSKEWIVLEKIK